MKKSVGKIYRTIKKTLKKALRWIDSYEERIWALIFMALFLMNTSCATYTFFKPGTESVTHYAVLAVLDLLICIHYLQIDVYKKEIDLLKKIKEKQHEIISQLLKDTPWKK
ncbi:hypothetical protein [Bacteroides sp.]|uniref:hypothetical protein n=1 Tax=Bacteroides sp. TaxID=29523 RepID=UPI00258FE1C9|nr:hypothetical protein [Bacteroides sp.]